MKVFEAIKNRRSVRDFEDRDVEEEKIERVLEAARWAPSWANTQCWRFVVVKNQENKSDLAEALSENNPAADAIIEAPVVIVACAKKKVSGYKGGEPATEKGDWYMFDTGLAMQNLMLEATNLGLGTVQIGYFNSERVREILDLPEDVAPVTMTPLGYPKRVPDPTSRKDLDEIVFAEKFEE